MERGIHLCVKLFMYIYVLSYTSRLAYADYLLSALMGKSVLPSTVYLLYDVGCKLQAHWTVHYCRLIGYFSIFTLCFRQTWKCSKIFFTNVL